MLKLSLRKKILNVFSEPDTFEAIAKEVYDFQIDNNPLFKTYVQYLPETDLFHFLPISSFKNHLVKTETWKEEVVFRSSGTTAENRSEHYVASTDWYDEVSARIFEYHFGPLENRPIVALLPGYLERKDASLVAMTQNFMNRSGHPSNGFFLDDFEGLSKLLSETSMGSKQGLFIGVSFALLDFADRFDNPLKDWIVMETGGMKGKRKELLRDEMHDLLKDTFGVSQIASEYGMTEMTAQSYSLGKGRFKNNPLLKIVITEIDDPGSFCKEGRLGRINIIDLSNLHTCSFLATDDLGRYVDREHFTVEGRLDYADIRGCNLLYN